MECPAPEPLSGAAEPKTAVAMSSTSREIAGAPGHVMSGLRWPRHQTNRELPNDALFMHGASRNCESGMLARRSVKKRDARSAPICDVAEARPARTAVA